MKKNIIKFWGVRGSYSITDSDKLEVGGDTPCVEIRTKDNDLIILDMGTGLNNLSSALLKEKNPPSNIDIFLSHYHLDHILGFLSFAPLFMDKFKINIYGKKDASGGVEKALNDILDERYWPVTFDMFNADLTFIDIKPGRIHLKNGISIESNLHPHPNGALGFRVELKDNVITYITDVEHPIGKTLRKVNHLARESDVLIHEAHFTPSDLPNYKGWGHCSWEEAVSVAKISKSKQLVLFHHSPTYSDDVINEFGEDAKEHFGNCMLAKQNLEIIL
ncbi:MAG: hypothetical protein CMG07_01830 [Candidatus Marinimicrobia bacterium]|nr:hypothetical protein [Candidatus Neomarinimicrobiota bacterium]|tara:strand:+ start:1262 stop:2089 length:828 start_codon:yes stop_codon:yes gene_type:complete